MQAQCLELLAPAKDEDTAKAAILAGADAVFMGGPGFGARAAAGNSLEAVARTCDFAHRFGAKVHLTLNTLLFDHELDAAAKLMQDAAAVGVDAIIFQDPAVLMLPHPDGVELHASTQCDLNSIEKLKFYSALGISQAVLPRELNLDEIKSMHEACPKLRLEVFIAGALCVGESGICYISELLTGRSANRGACAQICRLPMVMHQADGKEIARGHLLSLKDNWAGNDLEALVQAGVVSFKIEGRLKDASYVANVTAKMRSLLDKVIEKSQGRFKRAAYGKVQLGFTPDEHKTFNRGFTDAMLHGSNLKLTNIRSPKSIGEDIGTVISCRNERGGTVLLIKVDTGIELHNGDAFTCFNQKQELEGFRCNTAQLIKERHWLLQIPKILKLTAGLSLKRNIDTYFFKQLASPKALQRQMPLKASVQIAAGQAVISFIDELGRCGQASMPEQTEAAPLNAQVMTLKLKKLGDPYAAVTESALEALPHLPISAFNQLRREAFSNYLQQAQRRLIRALPQPSAQLPSYPDHSVDHRLIKNHLAWKFYQEAGVNPEKEVKALIARSVMTCRHCLIAEYACCTKHGGKAAGFYLTIGSRRFDLLCDCRKCRMHVLSGE